MCWGLVTIGTGVSSNYTQLAIIRAFLSVFEAGTYPVLMLIFNTMYRKS
jgi:MFS family permease